MQKNLPVSLSWIGLFLMCSLFSAQYIRPQNMLSFPTFPLFSLIGFALMGVMVLYGNISILKRFTQLKLIFYLFLLLSIITVFTPYAGRSFEGIRVFSQQFTFVIAFVLFVNTLERFKTVMIVLSFNVIFLVIYTFITQKAFGRYQMFETLSNFLIDPNELSLFLNMMIPWMILSVSFTKKTFIKLILWIGIFLTALLSLMTYSRGGALGFAVMIFIIVILHPKKLQLILLSFILMFIIIPFLGDAWINLIASSTNTEDATALTRFAMWNASWNAFLDNPLGYGPNTIPSVAYDYISDGVANRHHSGWRGDVAHSFWLTALAEWGIFGFIILVWLIFVNYSDAIKLCLLPSLQFNTIGATILASMTSFLVSTSFLTTNYYPHFWYLTAFICSVSYIMKMEV